MSWEDDDERAVHRDTSRCCEDCERTARERDEAKRLADAACTYVHSDRFLNDYAALVAAVEVYESSR